MAVVLQYAVYFLIVSSVVSTVRIVLGPTLVDRMIGFSMVSAQILAMLALLSVETARAVYLDVALVYDIFGFVGLLVIARYFRVRQELR